MHLLHGVRASAQMPVFRHFVCINCNTKFKRQSFLYKEPLAKQAALVYNLIRKVIGIDLPMCPQF